MPNGQIYFLNGPSFTTTTAVFLNSDLSVCAPDGYYTDGLVVRQQVDCVLLPVIPCPSCATDCPIDYGQGVLDPEGAYKISFDSGTSLGAIIIMFNPKKYLDGIKVEYNGLTYNSVSSTMFGYLSAPSGLATFLGNDANITPEGCQLDGETFVLDEYIYNGSSNTFDASGITNTITVDASQNLLTADDPANCYLVIPKTTATPSVVNITIYSICGKGDWELYAECPQILGTFFASIKQSEVIYPESCTIPTTQPYFIVYVNGTEDALDLYDWVFKDQYGAVVLDDGYYRCDVLASGDDTFRVENGVIAELLTVCS